MPGRIHLSEETSGRISTVHEKHNWVQTRPEKVDIKGKGTMQTYWLSMKEAGYIGKEGSTCGSDFSLDEFTTGSVEVSTKRDRLVDWHVDVLSNLLKGMIARRNAIIRDLGQNTAVKLNEDLRPRMNGEYKSHGGTSLDEVKEIIMLSKFDRSIAKHEQDPATIELGIEVISQLRSYVMTISLMYQDNPPFHNFEHASHVAMSVLSKLLSRIVMPSDLIYEGDENDETRVRGEIASTLMRTLQLR